MSTSAILDRLKGLLRDGGKPSWLRDPVPSVGVEVTPRRVTVVRVRRERSGFRLIGYGEAPITEGTVGAALLKCSVGRPEELAGAVRSALAGAGARAGRASLTLPDTAGRVTLLTVPELPHSQRQAEELLRFRMKRSLPLRPEEIAVSFLRLGMNWGPGSPEASVPDNSGQGPGNGDPAAPDSATGGSSGPEIGNGAGQRVLAVMAMRPMIEQHEAALASCGMRAGLVSLATIELANLCRREIGALTTSRADAALLNCEPEYSTLVIIRSGEPIFFRCKSHLESSEETSPEARLREMRRELSTSLSYYSERLGGTLPLAALVRNEDPAAEGIESILEEVGLSPASRLEIPASIRMPDGAAQSLTSRLSPAIGITAGRMGGAR